VDPAIELLESYGLVRDEDSLGVTEFSKKKITRLHRELYSAVFAKQQKDFDTDARAEIDPFSFVASRSLRGASDCGEYGCRIEKLDLLGHYAALYATKVIVPLTLQTPEKIRTEAAAAEQVSQSALVLLRLRPLVDAGLVIPVVMRSFHRCEHALAWANRIIGVSHKIAREAARDFQGDFRLKFQLPERSPTGLPTTYIDGPVDFLEHGGGVVTFHEGPGWRQKGWRYDDDGMVELRGRRKLMFLDGIFSDIADETTFYLAYGRDRNARYLASRTGETFLLDLFTQKDDELSASSAALNAYMTHVLPLLQDVPLARLLQIRSEERDSFARYRFAVGQFLTELVKKKKRIGKREVRDAFKSEIEPELVKMKSELNQERSRQVRRIVGGLGAMAASLKLGLFGAIPAVGAAGIGATLLGKAGVSVCEHGSSLKEKNDFYFLLRLTQEAEG
jgi:hypothetical protein